MEIKFWEIEGTWRTLVKWRDNKSLTISNYKLIRTMILRSQCEIRQVLSNVIRCTRIKWLSGFWINVMMHHVGLMPWVIRRVAVDLTTGLRSVTLLITKLTNKIWFGRGTLARCIHKTECTKLRWQDSTLRGHGPFGTSMMWTRSSGVVGRDGRVCCWGSSRWRKIS